MKKLISILLVLLPLLSNAQINRDLKRANQYFNRTSYSKAIPLYEKALKENKNFKAVKNLADSYYFTYNMSKASTHYKYLIKNYKSLLNETNFIRYSDILKANGKHTQAYNILHSFYQKNDSVKLKKLEKDIKYLDNIKAIGQRFSIKNLPINTSSSEFGAIQKEQKIVFAAPKKESTNYRRFGWTGNHYLDLYEVDSNDTLSNETTIQPFSSSINTKLHESNIIFTKDGKTAYFNRNNLVKGKQKKDSKKVTHIQLYKAQLINGKWTNITSLPFNNDTYSTEHPALSKDEKTLYFSSDIPNGYGSFDIYSVKINNNGSYGIPKNLGPIINTDKKEQFPFISKDNKLYFSSNGHPNFGALDVFVSSIKDNEYVKPDNVGLPVNSGYDDFAFNINSDTNKGYFASNRPEGKGSDDIYKLIEQKPLIIEDCYQFISGVITDIDTGEALNNVNITLRNNETISYAITDTLGKFTFRANCETIYNIKATKTGYKGKQRTLTLKNERKKVNDASMALKSLIQIEKEEKEALALQTKKEKELKVSLALQLKLDKQKKADDIIKKEKDIIKTNDQVIIKTEDINFDYKLWYLRRDTKKAIDKAINLMKKYPDMVVEVGTHSDIRGNNRYNLTLSQKRANSVRMYFMEKGIEPDRISAIGYGETRPIKKCKTEESCSEEEHELNRRCEFIVKKIN
ncbi:flagellar motor protein MotB [Tenacibaculum discolor]|uniref:Flagellar motor protein MotB n=1 Tax=Tenacibaculum discolor TaxID=361581 RepID=A0A2G1BU10_9FLAO|nr:OmpA family protein [Tenacibaculum discolor]MDP2542045.1 OmpA family protein [Tenacibaculum discolor]PHN97543.1 flagellar motor protein MotB [Tenacibaculum discolor]PHN99618.1 flagellar motor protein MotB [Rhodobacteraceae bacterium 4F10]